MLFKSKEGLELAKIRVRYTKNEEEFEKKIGEEGKQWWLDFAAKWEDTNIIEFVDIIYTAEQLSRFEEVKDIKVGEDVLNDYVIDANIENMPEDFKLKKENENLKQTLADLTETFLLGGI